MKGFLSKCIVLKSELLYDHQIYCLQARMCTLFSPEVLQAGAVKGLNFFNAELSRKRYWWGPRSKDMGGGGGGGGDGKGETIPIVTLSPPG